MVHTQQLQQVFKQVQALRLLRMMHSNDKYLVQIHLGGATPANNATHITVSSVGSSTVTYTNPTQSGYSGSGSSATFNVTKTGGTYTVAILQQVQDLQLTKQLK